MIENLAKRVVDWQIRKTYINGEERALYEYAFEVMINQAINILIAILIAVLLCAPMPVFVFLVSYIPLRTYCGGHHSRTNEGCIVVSAMLIFLVCLMVRIIPEPLAGIMPPMAFIISGLLIFRYSPVEDVNKPLSKEEAVHYRKKGRIVWLAEVAVGLFLFLIGNPAGLVMALSHLILSVMLYLGVLKNRSRL